MNNFNQDITVHGQNCSSVGFYKFKKREVDDCTVFDDFGKSGTELALIEGSKRIDIDQHQAGLVKCSDQIFTFRVIDACLAADTAVNLGQKCGWHLNKRDSPHPCCSGIAGDVANDTAAKRDHERTAINTGRKKVIVELV